MVEIMTAESVARETIKIVLESEIPKVNEAIRAAKKKGLRECYIKSGISGVTEKLLEKAGYSVDADGNCTEISWAGIYNRLMDKDGFLEEISKELNVKLVDSENEENTIDPDWKPSKCED